MTPSEIIQEASGLGFKLSENTATTLAGYIDSLLQWNKVINLVGTNNRRMLFRTLIIDSLYLERFIRRVVPESAPRCWDLGAGAGLPGIPLRMLWKNGSYTLVEAREKRAFFLKTVLARYPLPQTKVFLGRAELFMPTEKKADVIISRAFMPWEKLLDFVSPYLAQNGRIILLLNNKIELLPGFPWCISDSMTYPVEKEHRVFMAITAKN